MAYYERQCCREKQEAYRAIFRGVTAVESSIRVPLLPIKDLSEVYTRLRLDHPEVFYLTGFHLRCMPGAENGEFVPEYLFSKEKILSHRQAIQARVERLTREVSGKSEAEKILFLHRFITDNVRYDKLKKPYSHEVIGPLTQGVGVCEGIAKAVKLLSDALHIECLVALSAPEEGTRYGHAWNLLKRGGKWYHMDATFDLSLSRCGEARWDYFLLSDAQIYRDHKSPVYPVPACSDSSSFFYKEQKLSFTKQEDLAKRIMQAAKKKKPHFIFHWRGSFLTHEMLSELVQLISTSAAASGKYVQVMLNWPQAVFFVLFSDTPTGMEEPTMENVEKQDV